MKIVIKLFLMCIFCNILQSCTEPLPPASQQSQEVVQSMTDSIHKDLLKQ